jgi:chemotaxis protein CheD
MLEGLEARGIAKRELEIKVFGGANMFDISPGRPSVGTQNAEKALELLNSEGVRVVSSDLGGGHGRKIFFHTHTGEVFLKHLVRSER